VLGPLVVEIDGRPLTGLAAKERAVVAALALRAGRAVSVTELMAALWGEDPPRSGHKALQTYVSKLRRVLPDGVITTVGEGYCLACGVEEVDAGRFQLGVERARRHAEEADLRSAVKDLVEALGWWRGRALTDLLDQPAGVAEAARLEELRRGAEEDLIETRLGVGEHRAVVAEAEAAVAAEPLRERRWAQWMVALYRSGRQADALRAYRRLRERLAEELGIEPSAELVALEEAVLLQKRELAWQPPGDGRFPERRAAQDYGVAPDDTRPSLPSGVVSFVLTDIVGSTALWDAHPRDMAGVLERHDELITTAVSAHHGVMLKAKGEGDSTMSVFARGQRRGLRGGRSPAPPGRHGLAQRRGSAGPHRRAHRRGPRARRRLLRPHPEPSRPPAGPGHRRPGAVHRRDRHGGARRAGRQRATGRSWRPPATRVVPARAGLRHRRARPSA
jgi:DNA-binding SARP family transcriptional activator